MKVIAAGSIRNEKARARLLAMLDQSPLPAVQVGRNPAMPPWAFVLFDDDVLILGAKAYESMDAEKCEVNLEAN